MAVDLYAGQWDPKQGQVGFGGYGYGGGGGYTGAGNFGGGGGGAGAWSGYAAAGGAGGPTPGNYGPPEGDAGNIRGLAGGMAGQFKGNLGYADQALKDAFDPQQSAYKQQFADLTDASRAGQAARGISMSPYGAGVEANAQGRFANDWRDRQIGRESQGAQTATGLQGQWQSGQHEAAGMYAQAAGISQADIGLQLQAYGLRGDQLLRAQEMMMKYMQGNDALGEQRYEFERNMQRSMSKVNVAPSSYGY